MKYFKCLPHQYFSCLPNQYFTCWSSPVLHRQSWVATAILVVALLASAAPALAQALPSLASLSVGYNTQKRAVQPAGALKAQIDAIDREIAEARRLGRTGELRRLLLKGVALLAGGAWTDELEFARSLVIRSDRVIVDSSAAWSVRVEQIYQPSIQLERPLVARVTLRRPPAAPARGGGPPQFPALVKELVTRDGVSRDLRESPLKVTLDLAGVEDGPYALAVEILDGTRALGFTTQAVVVRAGLDATVDRLRRAAATAPESLRVGILYPVNRLELVNRGAMPIANFNPAIDLAAAETIAAAASAGKNPYDGKTGDFKRHYLLESAGEIMPYRLYVPTTYSRTKPHPLVIALHGLGGNEDSLFNGYAGTFQRLAEQHGFIVAAPNGYRADGFYGWAGSGSINRDDPETLRTLRRSEDDVMQVLQQVKRLYAVDDTRIYLMGHSMGAIGTWYLAPKFPDVWAALGPIAGIGDPATIERMRHIPQFVVHGDADNTVPVDNSRRMVERMKALGMNVTYIEVPGGDHVGVGVPNLPAMFEFFTNQKRR